MVRRAIGVYPKARPPSSAASHFPTELRKEVRDWVLLAKDTEDVWPDDNTSEQEPYDLRDTDSTRQLRDAEINAMPTANFAIGGRAAM